MFHAVTFALMDSVNALLIGVVVALGVMLPRGAYKKVAPLLVFGDWCGVLALALITLAVLDRLHRYVEAFMDTPILGVALIVIGLAAAAMTWRGGGEGDNALVRRLLVPLRRASWMTFATGFVLGVVQSVTSGPFFAGLIYLSQTGLGRAAQYFTLLLYAALALLLPALVAGFVGLVRARPNSEAGRAFARVRENKGTVARIGSYAIAALLVVMGATML